MKKYEIERSFLVDKTKEINKMSFEEFIKKIPYEESYTAILDGFEKNMPMRRLRKEGQKYTFTYKGIYNDKTNSREEYEEVLSKEEFKSRLVKELNEKTEIFIKDRYKINFICANNKDRMAELDIYHGNHEGFCSIEVEFESKQDAKDFTPPEWFGIECSGKVVDMLKNVSLKKQNHE